MCFHHGYVICDWAIHHPSVVACGEVKKGALDLNNADLWTNF